MSRGCLAKRSVAVALALALALPAGCAIYPPHSPEAQGGVVGGATGVVAGALIDGWRGGIIGGVLGAVAGATIVHIATQANREAARSNKPVSYSNDKGTHRVEAYPQQATSARCHVVRERIFENNQLVKETEREICE